MHAVGDVRTGEDECGDEDPDGDRASGTAQDTGTHVPGITPRRPGGSVGASVRARGAPRSGGNLRRATESTESDPEMARSPDKGLAELKNVDSRTARSRT